MVARPTGQNWVRADRIGGRCKAFLCRGGTCQGTSGANILDRLDPRRRAKASAIEVVRTAHAPNFQSVLYYQRQFVARKLSVTVQDERGGIETRR